MLQKESFNSRAFSKNDSADVQHHPRNINPVYYHDLFLGITKRGGIEKVKVDNEKLVVSLPVKMDPNFISADSALFIESILKENSKREVAKRYCSRKERPYGVAEKLNVIEPHDLELKLLLAKKAVGVHENSTSSWYRKKKDGTSELEAKKEPSM